jgi:hypothetical protein
LDDGLAGELEPGDGMDSAPEPGDDLLEEMERCLPLLEQCRRCLPHSETVLQTLYRALLCVIEEAGEQGELDFFLGIGYGQRIQSVYEAIRRLQPGEDAAKRLAWIRGQAG